MKKWALLGSAIVSECIATLSLKASNTEPAFYVLVAAGYAAAFTLMTRVLREGVPVGVAYGIWSACGVALAAIGASYFFGERITTPMLAGIGLIIAGVLCVELGSHAGSKPEPKEPT